MSHSQRMRELLEKAIELYHLKGVHPAAEIMPFMGEDEFESLVKDADENGFQNAVKVTDDQLLIDGRNRICASIVLEKDVHIEVFNPSDPLQYVRSENEKRRHLTKEQLAVVAIKAAEYSKYAEEAKQRQLATLKQNQDTVPQKNCGTEQSKKGETRDKLADDFGTNRDYVSQAIAVQKHAPELLDDVHMGKVSLRDASKEARQRKKEVKGQLQEAPKTVVIQPTSNSHPEKSTIKPDITEWTAAKVDGKVTMIPKLALEPTADQSSGSVPSDPPIEQPKIDPIETIQSNGYTLHIWHSGAAKPTFNTANESIDWAWSTWNPVTGCLHGCTYCLDPETLVLMANGTTKPIKDIRIGDDIVGVEKGDTYHVFKKTKVLNHWWTYKLAYEIQMSNGETLIASGDHRFLTNRGWKYVKGAMSGNDQRPYLTTSNKILGIGTLFETKTDFSEEYKLGQGGASVVSIKPIGYRHLVDVTTGTETFIANGFVSHNCYAERIANNERMASVYPKKFEPMFHPYRLDAPKHAHKFTEQEIIKKAEERRLDLEQAKQWAKNVFVCSMADLFGKWVPDEWILDVFDSVVRYPEWNYLFLTKYPQRLQEIGEKLGGSFPDNCWVGTTVDEQKRVRIAQDAFANIKAPVKWLSLEPLLTNLEFTDLGMFDMVAIGGETNGPTVTFTPEWAWVENILWQARKSNTAVYFKENLLCRPKEMPISAVGVEVLDDGDDF